MTGQDEIRRHIEACICPWCGAGPFRILGIHTNRTHGVSANELKKLAGLTTNATTASPDMSEYLRERAHETDFGSKWAPAGSEPRKRAAPKIAIASKARATPEAVRAFQERMASPEVEIKRSQVRNAKLQGHGTVANYKRGCRCEQCSEAKNAPRRSGRPVGKPPKYTDEHYTRALELMNQGETQREAARQVGVSEAWLSLARKAARNTP